MRLHASERVGVRRDGQAFEKRLQHVVAVRRAEQRVEQAVVVASEDAATDILKLLGRREQEHRLGDVGAVLAACELCELGE